jgi:uncharacterized tellurite resistance protein B-like protein
VAFDEDDLELAFQLHVVDLIVAADQRTTNPEQAFLDRHFPADELRARGFVDEAGARTQKAQDAAMEALAVLPRSLSIPAKHDLLDACFRLAVIDREFRLGEGAVLLMASRLLGLPDDDFDRFLAARPRAAGMSAALLDRDS